ncbi:MAG: hypothetical protein ACXWRE_06950 [Pseudobdellovibrionaceae bacterium]
MKLRFREIMWIFVSLSCPATFAQDLNFQQYRKFLMSGNQNSNAKMAIQTTCTNSAGQTFRLGEKAYDLCLSAAKAQNNNKQLTGSKESSALGSTPGTRTTIHFGN